MTRIGTGLTAGLAATVALSALMLIKSAAGMLPELDVIEMLAKMGHDYAGLPQRPLVGWIMHLIIGTVVWGVLFALLEPAMPTTGYVSKGLIFSVGAWLAMMIVVMPIVGAGLFGLGLGMAAPIATLVLHLVYGAVLGAAYGRLSQPRREPLSPSRM